MSPRLSIIIAAYNEQRHLPEQLRSIARQVCTSRYESDVEVIVMDDGSTDTTFDIACAFRRNMMPSMQIVVSADGNQGCAKATNEGARIARGDYFYIASANDVMEPRAIASIFEAIEAFHPRQSSLPDRQIDVIVGDVAGIHLGWGPESNNQVDGVTMAPRYLSPDAVARLLGVRGIIHAAGCVISQRAWDQHGGWDPAFWPYSETLTWHIAACRYGAVYTPNAFGWVRVHDGSASRTVLDRDWRRDIMTQAAQFVMHLEEPARSRLIGSRLWDIAEWTPGMVDTLRYLMARQYFQPNYRTETGGFVDRKVAEAYAVVAPADCVIPK